jgi:polyketide biosynthesis enoyl-CoA hydratase PksI
MKPGDFVSLDVNSDGVAVLRMHDAASGNGMSGGMVRALDFLLAGVAGREDVKVLVLAGLPEHFSSGATREILLELAESRIEPGDLVLPRRVLDIPVPTIAAMEGHALGGGLALGICCDLVLIARESRYGCPFMNYGFTPGMGTTRLLEHVMSPAIAHEMLLAGQAFKGSRFEGCSGFNYVMPRKDVWPKALDLANRIVEKPRESLVLLKANLVAGRRAVYEGALSAEVEMHRKTFANPEVIARILESSS